MAEILTFCNKILSYSVASTHMKNLLYGIYWSISSIWKPKISKLAVGNHIIAMALDSVLGFLLLQWILKFASPPQLADAVANAADEGVVQLRSLLNFLMGSPGGLKLNLPFNIVLGRFFTYNTNLWWVFLDQCEPLLVLACHAIEWLGLFGITTHLAIVSDLLSLASFHAYCIYVYAARMFQLQLNGLVALWRLFLGRKWNPMRQCVDSCDYDPSQLFAGVLTFTVLLFLLPTTLVYYAVFTSLRILFIAIEGLLFRLRTLVQCFPLFAFIVWAVKAKSICTNASMHLVPSETPGKPLELQMRPERASLSSVVECAVSNAPPPKPPTIEWIKYFRSVAFGYLF